MSENNRNKGVIVDQNGNPISTRANGKNGKPIFIAPVLNMRNLKTAVGKTFTSETALYSFLIRKVNGVNFYERYTVRCERIKNGKTENYEKIVIPKKVEAAMLMKISERIEYLQDGKSFYVKRVLPDAA